MNPQRDRGIRAEREACKLLTEHLGMTVRRRANEGIREDIGDLVGVPDTTVQVTAIRDDTISITKRVAAKLEDVAKQQATHGMTHAAVLLRIDGGEWRAIVPESWRDHYYELHYIRIPRATLTDGQLVRWGPCFQPWTGISGGYVADLETWAAALLWVRDHAG